MIIPLKLKYRSRFDPPKYGKHSENQGKKKMKEHNGPQILHCHCGGEVKVFNVYRAGRLHNEFRCLNCGRVDDQYYRLKEGME